MLILLRQLEAFWSTHQSVPSDYFKQKSKMHGKKPHQQTKTKKDKTRLLWAHFQGRKRSYHCALVRSNLAIPSLFNPQLKIFGSDSHFKANLTSGQSSPTFRCCSSATKHGTMNGCTQPPMPLAWPACCCSRGLLSQSARTGHTSGPHLRIASVSVGFCWASREKAIQAHQFPAYNQTHKAMGHKALLAQLHPEPFAIVLLVLFTADLLQTLSPA